MDPNLIFKEASKLLKEGLVDFVGTDVHNMSHIQSLKNAKIDGKSKFKKCVTMLFKPW